MATLFNLPASVPAVTLHAKYLGPDGRPLRGWVEILAPTPLTFPEAQAFVTGPVVIPLDAEGGFTATLPATDVAGSNPSDWAYWITEKLQGMRDRKPYAIKLPQALKDPWLDKLAPTNPGTPNYVGVEGNRIYQGAAVPPVGLGRHGDMYVRTEVTAAFLSVSDTRVTVYMNVDGTWVLQTGEVRGSKIYVNTGSTASTATKPGDLLIRSDNGDFYQRDATGWGTVKGNLKGPKGVPGSQVYAFATGTESQGVGVEGDFAIRTDTGNLYQYVTGAGWTVKGSIKGPIGLTGAQGVKGDKGDVGATGPAGATGAKGATGATGPQGPQGEPGKDGTGAGTVTAVNAVQPDGTGNVALAAGDVGALSTTGGTITPATGHGLTVYGSTDPATYFRITAEGHPYSNSTRATFYNVGIGDTATPFGGGKFVLGFKNAATVPTTNPTNGAVLYSEDGKLKLLNTTGDAVELGGVPDGTLTTADVNVANGVAPLNQFAKVPTANLPSLSSLYVDVATRGVANGVATLDGTGKVPTAQLPAISGGGAKNSWTPDALGFAAWSVDPAGLIGYNATNTKYTKLSRLYLSGFNITEPTPVNSVVMFARGYGGVAAVRVMVGIFREDGTRVATSAATNPTGAGQLAGSPPQMTSNHFGAVPVKLSTSPTLQPGRYWGAWVMTAGGTADFAYTHIANDGFAMGNFFLGKTFARSWYMESQTTMPSTVNQGASTALIDHDVPVMALAMT
jgi:hypothetical protein